MMCSPPVNDPSLPCTPAGRAKLKRKIIEEAFGIIAKIPPKIRKLINWSMTSINWPEIILDADEITLTKEEFKQLDNAGYYISFGCVACCGFGSLESEEKGDIITYRVSPCPCHPYSYFLTLSPKGYNGNNRIEKLYELVEKIIEEGIRIGVLGGAGAKAERETIEHYAKLFLEL